MSIFKRRDKKNKSTTDTPLKASKSAKSPIFDLSGDKKDKSFNNPPTLASASGKPLDSGPLEKSTAIKTHIPPVIKKSIPEDLSYTLKKVQAQKKLRNETTETDIVSDSKHKAEAVDTNAPALDTSKGSVTTDAVSSDTVSSDTVSAQTVSSKTDSTGAASNKDKDMVSTAVKKDNDQKSVAPTPQSKDMALNLDADTKNNDTHQKAPLESSSPTEETTSTTSVSSSDTMIADDMVFERDSLDLELTTELETYTNQNADLTEPPTADLLMALDTAIEDSAETNVIAQERESTVLESLPATDDDFIESDSLLNPVTFNDDDIGLDTFDVVEASSHIDTETDLSELRHDLTKISADVENGEALYRRAQNRIKNLSAFAQKAEVSFSLVSRLEPENRRLKARNLTLSRDLEARSLTVSRIQSDLTTQKRRVNELTDELNATNSELSKKLSILGSLEKDLITVTQDRDIQKLRCEREKSAHDIETQENVNLRKKISELNDTIDRTNTDKINLVNQQNALRAEIEDQRNINASLEKNTLDISLELEKANKRNDEMSNQIITIQDDIKTFKTQYEYNILTRDDRIFALESEIESLSKQLNLKDEILANTSMDADNLRKTRSESDLERERLERLIYNQSQQLQLAEEQLLKSRANIQELDKRYKDATEALSRVHHRRSDQSPSQNPDIHPVSSPVNLEELENLIAHKR